MRKVEREGERERKKERREKSKATSSKRVSNLRPTRQENKHLSLKNICKWPQGFGDKIGETRFDSKIKCYIKGTLSSGPEHTRSTVPRVR